MRGRVCTEPSHHMHNAVGIPGHHTIVRLGRERAMGAEGWLQRNDVERRRAAHSDVGWSVLPL